MKNQQDQHQLNLVSTSIFKIFFVFLGWLVSVQKTYVLKKLQSELLIYFIGGTEHLKSDWIKVCNLSQK